MAPSTGIMVSLNSARICAVTTGAIQGRSFALKSFCKLDVSFSFFFSLEAVTHCLSSVARLKAGFPCSHVANHRAPRALPSCTSLFTGRARQPRHGQGLPHTSPSPQFQPGPGVLPVVSTQTLPRGWLSLAPEWVQSPDRTGGVGVRHTKQLGGAAASTGPFSH